MSSYSFGSPYGARAHFLGQSFTEDYTAAINTAKNALKDVTAIRDYYLPRHEIIPEKVAAEMNTRLTKAQAALDKFMSTHGTVAQVRRPDGTMMSVFTIADDKWTVAQGVELDMITENLREWVSLLADYQQNPGKYELYTPPATNVAFTSMLETTPDHTAIELTPGEPAVTSTATENAQAGSAMGLPALAAIAAGVLLFFGMNK